MCVCVGRCGGGGGGDLANKIADLPIAVVGQCFMIASMPP